MNRKPSLLVVFLTVFIDLIGFVIGAIIASFSAMQFIFSPIWGKLSDRHGRRPILLISTAGAVVSLKVCQRHDSFFQSQTPFTGARLSPAAARWPARVHRRLNISVNQRG